MAVSTTNPGTAPSPRGTPTSGMMPGTPTENVGAPRPDMPNPGNPDYQNPINTTTPSNPGTGTGTGTGTTTPPGTPWTTDPTAKSAYNTLVDILTQYGLQSLVPTIQQYMQQGITDQATLMLMLRASPEYKARFPAMDTLNQKGRGFTEADYINYERNAANTEQQYGLPKGFLTDPHRIAGMLEADVSASEVTSRAQLNAAVAADAPQETKDALKNLYGLDQSALTAYYFDPENALPYLQKQYSAATVAGQAAFEQISVDRQTAEQLAAQGVTMAQAQQGFSTVASMTGLETGQGETASQADLIAAAFGDAQAKAAVQRVGQGRINQFAGSGTASTSQQGVSGLGSSGTR